MPISGQRKKPPEELILNGVKDPSLQEVTLLGIHPSGVQFKQSSD